MIKVWTRFRWMSPLLAILLLAAMAPACGSKGGGSNNNNPPGDDDDDVVVDDDDIIVDDDDDGFTPQEAQSATLNVVTQIQTQQNAQAMSEMNAQAVRGIVPQKRAAGAALETLRKAMLSISQPILLPGPECATVNIDYGADWITLDATYAGDCVVDGVTYSGHSYLHVEGVMDGDNPDLTITMTFEDYSENGVLQNGTMTMTLTGTTTPGAEDYQLIIEFDQFVQEGGTSNGSVTIHIEAVAQGTRITMTFEGFTTAEGETLSGSMTAEANEDGSHARFEFQDFQSGQDTLDGFFEVNTDNLTTLSVEMDITGTDESGSFSGQYSYTATDNLDGTYTFTGDGNYTDVDGQEVVIDFEFTVDPAQCGDIPSTGHMTLTVGGTTYQATFLCDHVDVQ